MSLSFNSNKVGHFQTSLIDKLKVMLWPLKDTKFPF